MGPKLRYPVVFRAVAARMASAFKLGPKLTPHLFGLMSGQLELLRASNMSPNVAEIVNNTSKVMELRRTAKS